MKKIIVLLVLTAVILTGCTSRPTTKAEPIDTAGPSGWCADLQWHWKEGANGARAEVGEHSFDSNGFCEVCSCNVADYGDGSLTVSFLNGYGDTVYSASYVEGVLDNVFTYENSYSDDGSMQSSKSYMNGVLFEETSYRADGDGNSSVLQNIHFFKNGERSVTDYDEMGKPSKETEYAADGSVISENIYNYKYDGRGEIIDYTSYTNGKLAEDFDFEYNDEGFTYPCRSRYYYADGTSYCVAQDQYYNNLSETEYDADGKVTSETVYEYTFDSNNNVIYTRSYLNGVLFQEIEGAYDEDGCVYDAKVITYYPDGSKNVYISDADPETVSNITYDAQGNVIES